MVPPDVRFHLPLPLPPPGDGPDVGLLPHQLRELVVMAGLDPAAPATRSLVAELTARKQPGTVGAREGGVRVGG